MLTFMKDRLQTILNLEKLSAAQLATLLNIQRSTLSNLMSGRNNPSYDFILAIMTKLPNLNVEWLLRGEGQPYKSPDKNFRGERLSDAKLKEEEDTPILSHTDADSKQVEEKQSLGVFDANEEPQYENGNLFGFSDEIEDFPSEDENTPYHPFPALEEGELAKRVESLQSSVSKPVIKDSKANEPAENPVFEEKAGSTPQKKSEKELVRILLLYSDGSFESFEK